MNVLDVYFFMYICRQVCSMLAHPHIYVCVYIHYAYICMYTFVMCLCISIYNDIYIYISAYMHIIYQGNCGHFL